MPKRPSKCAGWYFQGGGEGVAYPDPTPTLAHTPHGRIVPCTGPRERAARPNQLVPTLSPGSGSRASLCSHTSEKTVHSVIRP